MRLRFLFDEFKKNWVISTIGLVLFGFGAVILNVNEGKKIKFAHGKML
jgi:hypothetical protein